MRVAVGSQNPAKLEAVELAFSAVWPDEPLVVEGVAVASGVSDQPMSDEESIKGAHNRARRARAASGADFGVGLEGGLHEVGGAYFDCGWIVVVDAEGNKGIGSTAKVVVPRTMIEMIRAGDELGVVADKVFGTENAKQKEGYFGLFTKGAISRSGAYRDGVIVALGRFLHPHFF